MDWKKLLEEKAAAIVAMLCVTLLAGLKLVSPDVALGVLLTAAGLATTGRMSAALKPKADQ